jgi:uncharacterized protein YeeX (DUF496 family)|tara:strand:- start:137 stop:637 length:501 start_codon:yes stop_codon:yes gene_type:complete
MQLSKITGQYLELSNLAGDPESELTTESIQDTLESIQGEFNDKAVAVTHIINEMGLDVEKIDSEITRLQKRKTVLVNRNNDIRDYLKHNMISADITNIKCPLFSITLAKGRDTVSIHNEFELDDEYVTVKTSITPDKRKILKALQLDPESVKGATLTKTEQSLRIK